MQKLFLIFLLFCMSFGSYSQQRFNENIALVCQQLNFELSANGIKEQPYPDTAFVQLIKACAKEAELAALQELQYQSISSVKYASLKSVQAKQGIYARISCQEWTFESAQQASHFMQTLQKVNAQDAQFCINKGGLIWWQHAESIMLLSSQAYASTFYYNNIKKIFIDNQ